MYENYKTDISFVVAQGTLLWCLAPTLAPTFRSWRRHCLYVMWCDMPRPGRPPAAMDVNTYSLEVGTKRCDFSLTRQTQKYLVTHVSVCGQSKLGLNHRNLWRHAYCVYGSVERYWILCPRYLSWKSIVIPGISRYLFCDNNRQSKLHDINDLKTRSSSVYR